MKGKNKSLPDSKLREIKKIASGAKIHVEQLLHGYKSGRSKGQLKRNSCQIIRFSQYLPSLVDVPSVPNLYNQDDKTILENISNDTILTDTKFI